MPKTGSLSPAEATRVRTASASAPTSPFHLGVLIAGLLMIAGGVASGFGIENGSRRQTEPGRSRIRFET